MTTKYFVAKEYYFRLQHELVANILTFATNFYLLSIINERQQSILLQKKKNSFLLQQLVANILTFAIIFFVINK